MAEIADIRDRETFEAWLQDKPREAAALLAHRAAMRVMPLVWTDWPDTSPESDLTWFAVLRANMISGVAAMYPTPDIKAAAATATYAADAADAAAATATYAADAATTTAAAELWEAVRDDCRGLADGGLEAAPLWHGLDTLLSRHWPAARAELDRRGDAWAFWIGWYQDALAGNSDWPFLKKVVETVTEEDWDAGPERVAEVIAGLAENRERDGVLRDHAGEPLLDSKGEPLLDSSGAPVQAGAVKKVQVAVAQNREDILPQIEALLAQLDVEIERVRGGNPADELQQADKDRALAFLTGFKRSMERLSDLMAERNEPVANEASEIAELLQVFKTELQLWPRDNAADLVDSTARLVLVGGAASIFALAGMPWLVAAGIGGVAYGGKKLVDIGKRVKEVAPKDIDP